MAKKVIPAKLSIDRDIDDDHIWFVEIKFNGGSKRMPCRESTLRRSFNAQNKSWDVGVLGRWINGNGGQFETIKEF